MKRKNHTHNKVGVTPQKIVRKPKSLLCSYNVIYLLSKEDDCTLQPSPANHLWSQGTSTDGLLVTVMHGARTKGHQLKLLGTWCRTAKRDHSSHRRQVCESLCQEHCTFKELAWFIGRSGEVLNREVNWSLPYKLLYVQVQGEDIRRLSRGANILHAYPALSLLKEATCE